MMRIILDTDTGTRLKNKQASCNEFIYVFETIGEVVFTRENDIEFPFNNPPETIEFELFINTENVRKK